MITLLAATILSCSSRSVIDGDTIKCSGQNMRLIGDGVPFKTGIDTLETGWPGEVRAGKDAGQSREGAPGRAYPRPRLADRGHRLPRQDPACFRRRIEPH